MRSKFTDYPLLTKILFVIVMAVMGIKCLAITPGLLSE